MLPHVPQRPPRVAMMRRYTFSIPTAMGERIHKLALDAEALLGCEVSHAALFRAAIAPWIKKAEGSPLVNMHEEILGRMHLRARGPSSAEHRGSPTEVPARGPTSGSPMTSATVVGGEGITVLAACIRDISVKAPAT